MIEFEIQELRVDDPKPYSLLLDADPSQSMVDAYLLTSRVYVVLSAAKVIGVYVLNEIDAQTVEMKNIAVSEEFQRKGLGTQMIADAEKRAIIGGYNYMQIGTSNASIWQMYLYQKLGFDIIGLKMNFFTDNYSEPLFENGIRVKHMIMLNKQL